MMQSIAFDRAATYYDDTRGFPPGVEQDTAKTIAQVGKLTSSSRILEIGIGTGRIALPLAKHVSHVHGLDLSRPMMMRLRSKQVDEPIYLVQADATRLPYPDDSFDAVVAVHVFHLISNWQGVLAELSRVLKLDAPVIHCWSTNNEIFKTLWAAWHTVVPEKEASEVGLRWNQNENILQSMGWRVGDTQSFDFAYQHSPAKFIEQLENRIWSRTWRLSEESLAAGVAAVKNVVKLDYANPKAHIPVNEQFIAKAYYPPQ